MRQVAGGQGTENSEQDVTRSVSEGGQTRALAEHEDWVPLRPIADLPPVDSWSLPAAPCPPAPVLSDLLLTLANRVAKLPLPPVTIVDTRNDPLHHAKRRSDRPGAQFARCGSRSNDGGQVILFLNLRGFSPDRLVQGVRREASSCPHCDITLTFHKDKNRVLCHSCEYAESAADQVPELFDHPGDLLSSASGLSGLEAGSEIEIRQVRPASAWTATRCVKHGQSRRGTRTLPFGRGSKILLGTQMIAKGLDFPNVTLVGVINADTLLHAPDLRASERTFQLIAQVAGRTGRSARGGRVFVQTACPTEPAIALAAQHDYLGFVAHELKQRREADAPPYRSLTRIILRGPKEERVKHEALVIAALLRSTAETFSLPVRILGPAPAQITKIRDNWRFHIQMTAAAFEIIRDLWRAALPKIVRASDVEFQIDVDPMNTR